MKRYVRIIIHYEGWIIMKNTTLLKQLLQDEEVLIMPGCFDVISAMVIEKCGFKATQVSGFGLAGSLLGKPDVGILSFKEMLEQTRNICAAVTIPVMADGDTGFGNAVNTYNTVQCFEAAGAAGVNLEDQTFPKRCGHMDGKEVIPIEEMIAKIHAAVDARKDPDFIINARTDAIAVYGVEEAIRRGNAYAEAGADLIFVEAPNKVEEIKHVIRSIKAPVSINMLDGGGKTPVIPISVAQEWGVARLSMPVTPLFASIKGMMDVLMQIKEDGAPISLHHPEMIVSFNDYTDMVGLPEIKKMQTKYSV